MAYRRVNNFTHHGTLLPFGRSLFGCKFMSILAAGFCAAPVGVNG